MRVTWLAIAAVALAAQTSQAALTCKFDLQTRVASTLANPPIASSSSDSSDGSSSGSSTSKKKKNSSTSDGSGTGSGTSMKDVGNSDGTDGSGDAGSAGDGAGAGTATTAPSSTTSAPTSTTKAPTTPTSTTKTPTSTTKTPTATTAAPVTTAPTTAGSTTVAPVTAAPTTSGSNTGTTPSAGTTRRRLATTDAAATVAPGLAVDATVTAGDTTTAPTTAPGGAETTTAPGVGGSTAGSNSTTANASTNSTSTATSGTNVTVVDSFTCDETFYKQWDTLGIKCGGASIDVAAAVSAASCVIYSGTLGDLAGTSCVSICAFPACVNNAWSYGASNGIASSVYSSVGIAQFYNTSLAAGVASRLTGSAVLTGNTTLVSNKQCAFSNEDSFSSCSCSALAAGTNKTDAQIKKQREEDKINGVISEDKTTNVGSVLAPTTQSVAGVTVFVSAVAAIASTAVGSVSAAGASVAVAGANVAVFTIEVCQFGVMINQMNLEGKSAALALFGKQMAPSAFTFLPFGKLNEDETDDSTRRRLTDTDNTSSNRGVASYSRTLGIREDMLFLVTLAGVVVVVAGVLILFGVAYGAAGLFMSREDFLLKFFDKMIGLLVLILILSQYTIGVTATYQIYYSSGQDNLTDPKCILAMISLLVLALGIVFYGYIIVKRYEDEIRDVGTVAHMNKVVCMRYGPFYDEYKFKCRFFFASKMMLALISGVATGYVGMQAKYQVSILLAAHVIFFFYLEVQSPHHSKFVQTTTSFVTIMKIATLALTFFLISATASSDLPSEMQNGISLAIVGLNLFVLFLLMVRSLYAFWKKYQMQRDAKYDENDDQSAAQEYFKDDNTPHNKGGQAGVTGGKSKEQNAYVAGGANAQYDYQYGENSDDIRLRSATHLQQSAKGRGSYEDAPPVRYDQISRNGAQHYIVNNNQHAAQDPYSSNAAVPRDQQQRYQQQQYQQPQSANNSQEQFVVTNSREQALYNQRRNDVVEL